MAKLASHKQRAIYLLTSLGWTVADVEIDLRHSFHKRDLFGFADLLAFNDDLTLALQVTDPSNVSKRVEKCLGERRLALWLRSANRIAEVWGMRDKPAGDGTRVLIRSFEVEGNTISAFAESDILYC